MAAARTPPAHSARPSLWPSACARLLTLAIATASAPRSARAEACTEHALFYRAGRPIGWLCPSQARARGLTWIDLGDAWAPLFLTPGPSGDAPDYRDAYVALANERAEAITEASDRYLELHGIPPSLAVVYRRMSENERYRCHEAIETAQLADFDSTLREETSAAGWTRLRAQGQLRRALEGQMARRGLESLDVLAAVSRYYARQVATYRRYQRKTDAIRTAQRHLACLGLVPESAIDGILSWRTTTALSLYQRRSFLLPTSQLDAPTKASLLRSARSEDLRTALRVLRERVADAAGLIEDGSAGSDSALVAGRQLSDRQLGVPHGRLPLARAAPDSIGNATNAAATALGWTSHEHVRRFLSRHVGSDGSLRLAVAVDLGPPPAYHSAHMDLEVDIDPGDAAPTKRPGTRRLARRPSVTVYARDGDDRVPLVSWPTTVGGWQDKRLPTGTVAKRYMPSDFGDYVWRDLYVGPRWLPPDNTPHDDVVKRLGKRWAVDRALLGPSYRSAYGMAMLVHHQISRSKGASVFIDRGVRTHGTGNLLSLSRADSHGCHRLLGFQAARLASFLLRHRSFTRSGAAPTVYRRVFRHHGLHPVAIRQRGYLFQLDPPVPVHVGKRAAAH